MILELPKVSCNVWVDDSKAFEDILHVGETEKVAVCGKFQHRYIAY